MGHCHFHHHFHHHFFSIQVNIDTFPYYLHTIFHLVIQLTSDQSYQSPMTSFQYGISTNKLQFYHVRTFQFKVWHFNLPCILQSRNSRSQTYSVRWQYLGSVETGWNSASFNILTTYIQYKSLILVSLRAEPARIRQRDVQKVWQSVRHFCRHRAHLANQRHKTDPIGFRQRFRSFHQQKSNYVSQPFISCD